MNVVLFILLFFFFSKSPIDQSFLFTKKNVVLSLVRHEIPRLVLSYISFTAKNKQTSKDYPLLFVKSSLQSDKPIHLSTAKGSSEEISTKPVFILGNLDFGNSKQIEKKISLIKHLKCIPEVPFTNNELGILSLGLSGFNYIQIGEIIGRSSRTVEMHIKNAMEKLGCFSKAQSMEIMIENNTLFLLQELCRMILCFSSHYYSCENTPLTQKYFQTDDAHFIISSDVKDFEIQSKIQKFPLFNNLTDREVSLLCLYVCGLSAKQIAFLSNISFRTVEQHIKNSFLKLGSCSRTDLLDDIVLSGTLPYWHRFFEHLISARRKFFLSKNG